MTRDTERAKESIESTGTGAPAVIACIIVVPTRAETLASVFQELIQTFSPPGRDSNTSREQPTSWAESPDKWLSHAEAAKYLGLSQSTLYHHAGRARLESRKFCGRLQYRIASLDRFKNQTLRPVRSSSQGRP